MKAIEYKGKAYITVNERLKEFRNTFKGYSLITEIIELGNDYATIKASVIDDKGTLRATGFAREVVAKSPTNKFAFLENCETSAIGRALGNFGIGIDTAVCTADELIMKLSQSGELAKDEIEVKEEVAPEETKKILPEQEKPELSQELLTAIAECGTVECLQRLYEDNKLAIPQVLIKEFNKLVTAKKMELINANS